MYSGEFIFDLVDDLDTFDTYLEHKKRVIVSFDGPDGVGKTTLVYNLAVLLDRIGYNVRVYRQPDEKILRNQVMYSATCTNINRCKLLIQDTEILMGYISQAEDETIILLDRCIYTSMPVYQFPEMTFSDIITVNKLLNDCELAPDLMYICVNGKFINKNTDGIMEVTQAGVSQSRFENLVLEDNFYKAYNYSANHDIASIYYVNKPLPFYITEGEHNAAVDALRAILNDLPMQKALWSGVY